MAGATGGGTVSSLDPRLILDPPSITWELPALKGTPPPGRSGHTATEGLVDGELLLFGGGGDGTYFNDLWRFDCQGLKWNTATVEGSTPEPRAYHTAVIVGQRLFIFGGWNGDAFINDLSILEAHGDAEDCRFAWKSATATGVAPGPRAYHTAATLDSRLIIFGGWGAQDFCADVAVLRVADSGQPAWETLSTSGQGPKARAAHSCTRIGDLLYVFGGESSDGRLNDVVILDVNAGQWMFPTCAGTPPSPRSGHRAAAVGKWLVVYGGWDGDRNLVDIHLLDTVGMRWVSAPTPVPKESSSSNVLEGRSGYAFATVANHRLLVMGGWDRERFLMDVVVLDTSELILGLDSGAGTNRGLTEILMPPDSPVWLQEVVEQMKPKDRARVAKLPEWKTFAAQAPKIVESVDMASKAETINFMQTTAMLLTRIDQKASDEHRTFTLSDINVNNDRNPSAMFSGSLVALQTASMLGPNIKHWTQPYAAKFPRETDYTSVDVEARGSGASLAEVVQGSIKERALLGGASLLKMLLRREFATSRLHNEKISSLAREVNVQPLFQAYGDLKSIQDTIRAHKSAPDALQLSQHMAAQDEIHRKCTGLAEQLTSRLREMVTCQQQRYGHVRSVSAKIKGALESCQTSTTSQRQTNSTGLPEYLTESDAFADIEEALEDWETWETENEVAFSAFSATDEALVALNSALVNELASIDTMERGTVLQGEEKARCIVRAARRFVDYLNTNVFDSEVHQTESLLADCNSLVTELATIDADRKEAQEIQVELKSVMAAHLKASEAVIRNHAEMELLRLHETNGEADINEVETRYLSAKKIVADLAESQASLEAKLAGFAQSNVPELLFSANPKLAKRLLHTGLVVDRRLSDYEQIEVLHGARHHVLLVKLNNRVVVLKEIALNDEAARKVFENEVGLLWKLKHPAIVKVDAVFYEGLRAYIQMPYISQGTLGQWLASNPKPWKVQSVFRQLVQGLAFMHDHGIVHRDIKMDNILMTADTHPVICDFGISHEHTGTASTGSTRDTRTTGGGHAPAGTEGYIAPEVLCGRRATPAADMWAFGVLLCKAYLGCEPEVTERGVIVHERFPGEPVQLLVEGCLRLCPNERLTANEALANPFFSVSQYKSLSDSKQLLESGEKIELLRRQARLYRQDVAFALHVRRAQIVEDALEAFKSVDVSAFQPFHVHFIGEPAVGGGLVCDFYTSFFSGLCSKRDLFEGAAGFVLPRSDCGDLESLRMVGGLLGRCIVDRCSVGQFGAPSLFKFLLDISPSLVDLEVFDSSAAIGLRNLLLTPAAKDIELFFEDGTRVEDANKRDFVEEQVLHVLVGCRSSALRALKSGFEEALGDLREALSIFSVTELMLLLCGDSHIDGHMVASALRFAGWPTSSTTPGHFIEVIHEMQSQELRRLLRLATSNCSLDGNQITVQRCPASERLPVGRTCFRRLDLPDYEDKDLLRAKLSTALQSLDEAFTLF